MSKAEELDSIFSEWSAGLLTEAEFKSKIAKLISIEGEIEAQSFCLNNDAELDSPNFIPQSAKDFASRGFQRINLPRK